MSRIRADKFVNSGANGAPQLTFGAEVVAGVGLTGAGGINITGVATAASFSGAFSGDLSIDDKIIHTGDTNTAIRFPAADTFTVETAGSERLRTDSSGRVLIGTTNAVAFGSRQVLAVANGTTGAVLSLYNSTTAANNPRISSNPGGSEINDIGIHAASTNGNIIAYTNNDTERLRITSAGEVQIANGNLKFSTSGTGIDFSATADGSGTATSELLDDYEEGTWTPILKFGGANTGLAASYTGKYTKIGDTVHYYFRANLTNKGSSTGAATIEGLPFTCGPYYCTTIARIYNANSLSGPIMPRTQYNGSYIALVEQNASGESNLTNTHFNNDSQLLITGTYFI